MRSHRLSETARDVENEKRYARIERTAPRVWDKSVGAYERKVSIDGHISELGSATHAKRIASFIFDESLDDTREERQAGSV